MKRTIQVILLLILIALPYFSLGVEGDQIKIDLFVMSMCPFGIQTQNIIIPIIKQLGDKVQVNIFFVASENENSKDSSGTENAVEQGEPVAYRSDGACVNVGQASTGRFSSLHGNAEVVENIRQLLIIKYYNKQYYDYLMLRNKDIAGSNHLEIMKSLGIDSELIENLVKSEEGDNLLSENIKEARKRAVNASPTIFINGKLIEENITANRIYRNLCKFTQLSNCGEIPECGSDNDCPQRENLAAACINPELKEAKCIYGDHIPVKIAVISVQKIESLNPETLIRNIINNFPAAEVSYHDYKSEKAKELIGRYSLESLPAIIFEEKLETSVRFSRIAPILKKNNDAYIIKSQYLPNRFYLNRTFKRKALELFVNSMSENSARLQNLLLTENYYSFSVNYNADVSKKKKDNQLLLKQSDDGNYSLSPTDYVYDIHSQFGKEDLMEDIRQLCLYKYNPELVAPYLRCFTNELLNQGVPGSCLAFFINKNQKIDDCIAKSEGIEMLAKNAAYSKNIEIGSDTAVMIHNQILLQEFDFNVIYEILEKSDL